MDNKRKIIGGLLVTFIIVMGVITYMNKDTFFQSRVEKTYSDGCVEVYINTELTTPICENGRKLEEQMNNRNNMLNNQIDFDFN